MPLEVDCEWGEAGFAHLHPDHDGVTIVDVLSFSTCVDIAVGRGATILPYGWKDDTARTFAEARGAELAGPRDGGGLSLSPASLKTIPYGTALVLPSPNGATLSRHAGRAKTWTGCLRNATAVADAAGRAGTRIAVIPAGERWPDGTLRPAIEDWLGAGAIIDALGGRRSPEAELARQSFVASRGELDRVVHESRSGQELIGRGFPEDVRLATELDVSEVAPLLRRDGDLVYYGG